MELKHEGKEDCGTRKRKMAGWVIGFVSIVLIFGNPSMGDADVKDMISKFQPYITIEEEFNDNINLTARHRLDDLITTISPGLRFSTLTRPAAAEERYGVDLDFRAGLVFYAKEEDNDYISLHGTLSAWYKLGKGFAFRVREYLIRSDEPRERDYAAGALPGQYLLGTQRGRDVYFRNVFEPSLEYRFGRENLVSIHYRNNVYDSQSRWVEDSMENYISPSLTYWFNIRNGVFLQYGFTRGTFDGVSVQLSSGNLRDVVRSPDFSVHSGMGRYTYRFNPRTSIFGEYSFVSRHFDSSSTEPDYDIHAPSMGISHAFSPSLDGSGQVGYYWQDPQRGSTMGGLSYRASLSKRLAKTSFSLAFQGGYTEDYFSVENLGFSKYHRLIGTVTHRFMERITIGGYGSLERGKSRGDLIDRIWGVGVSGSYQILRWVMASLEVSHRENHSKISDRDYSEYRAILRVTATFNN